DFLEMALEASLEYDFGGFQGLQEFVCVFGVAFRHKEFTGGDVEKGNAEEGSGVAGAGSGREGVRSGPVCRKIDTRQENVFVAIEEPVVCGYARCDHFSDASFDD